MISRRAFLATLAGCAVGSLPGPSLLLGAATYPRFYFAQVRYRGGEWDPNPRYAEPITEEIELRTSITGEHERRVVTLTDPAVFFCPFLYMAGKHDFEPFTALEREALRRFLSFGGFLLAEDAMGAKGSGFDQAFRREMRRILPGKELQRLPPDHPVFQSFYLLSSTAGRLSVSPYLEGVMVDNWTPVIYTQNDLAGAWSRDKLGKWVYECTPGGEGQRASAFKLGVNLVVYSLTSDYKKDLVHHPFIKKRRGI